jgi:EmrB/QacA subfamily drug resistance transporter
VLFCCCFALFVVTVENTIANVALPQMQASLGASDELLQWIVAAYVVVRGSLLMSAGALADRFGRRRIFKGGLIVFALGSALCAAAPTGGLLVCARVVQAVGGAALTPSTMAIAVETFPEPELRARAIGYFAATIGLGTAIGPLAGGVLTSLAGWRSVFWVDVPLAAVAFVLAATVMRESASRVARRLDVAGQALATGVLAALTYAFISEPGAGWGTWRVAGMLGLGGALLATFLVVERCRDEPLLELSAFRDRRYAGANLIAFAVFLGFNGFVFYNMLYLQEIRGHTPLIAGLLTLPATVTTFALGPISGRITARRGPRLPATIATCAMTVGAAALATAGVNSSMLFLSSAYALIGAGLGLASPAITTAAVASMPPERAGIASGTTIAARQAGAAFGIALVGTVVFGHFAAALPRHLAEAQVPPVARAAVVRDATASLISGGAERHGSAVDAAIHAAFAEALRRGYALVAFVLLGAAVVSFVALRSDRHMS